MPWTVDNPPRPAKNWTKSEKKKCVKAANAVLKDCDGPKDKCEAQAIYACIRAAGKSKDHAVVMAGLSALIDAFTPPDDKWPFLVPIEKGANEGLLFPYGKFFRWGAWKKFEREQGAEMIEHFEDNILERVNGWLPINEEHDRRSGRIAYITQLFDATDGVHYTYDVVDEDAFSKYDYLSPEIAWSWTHPFTSKVHENVLMGAGVTNYPFLLGRTALRKDIDGMSVYGDGRWSHFEKSAPLRHDVTFSLAQATQQIAYGAVFVPDRPDAHGHVMTAEEIERGAHRFMERLMDTAAADTAYLDKDHEEPVYSDAVRIVESWVQRDPTVWEFDDREVEIPAGTWCMGVKFLDDELWQQVVDGEITGFSPTGMGVLTPLEE